MRGASLLDVRWRGEVRMRVTDVRCEDVSTEEV